MTKRTPQTKASALVPWNGQMVPRAERDRAWRRLEPRAGVMTLEGAITLAKQNPAILRQYARNAAQLEQMAAAADAMPVGQTYRGFTRETLRERATFYRDVVNEAQR